MALSTFAELKTSIADWLLRTDLTSVIPDLITLAEAQMNRDIKHWRMETTTDLSVSTQYTTLPTDFIEATRATLDTSPPYRIELISRGDMQERRERTSNTTGKPVALAITHGKLEVYPTPDSTYTVEFEYLARPGALSDSNTSNWVLTYHPDVYLFGALLNAAPYLVDDARIPVWAGLYKAAIEAVNRDGEMGRFGATSPRVQIRSY